MVMTDLERDVPLVSTQESLWPPLLGPWGVAVLMLVSCLVVWTTAERYMDPVGEKYVYTLPPGGADFFFAFGGAQAVLLGADPYHNEIPGLADFWEQKYLSLDGKQVRGYYPPTHFLLYLPLAMLTDSFRVASRMLFAINVSALFLLSYVIWRLIVRIGNLQGQERQSSMLLVPLIFAVLACNPATSLALERGNGGDILGALFCWSAILLFLDGRFFTSTFMMVPAALIKGYAVWCGLGIWLLGLKRETWARTVAGSVLGLAVFLLPVLRYVPEALEIRRKLFASSDQVDWMSLWWNHGFRNVLLQVAPSIADSGWLVIAGSCGAIMVACWVKARQAEREGRYRDLAFWAVLFTTSSIELMLGSNPISLIYNLVLVLPGMLIVMLLPTSFARTCGLPGPSIPVLGVLNLAAIFCVFKSTLFNFWHFPLPGIGMIVFLMTVGGAMLLGRFHSPHRIASTGSHVGVP